MCLKNNGKDQIMLCLKSYFNWLFQPSEGLGSLFSALSGGADFANIFSDGR